MISLDWIIFSEYFEVTNRIRALYSSKVKDIEWLELTIVKNKYLKITNIVVVCLNRFQDIT